MSIFWREMKINRRGLVIWTAILIALGVLVMALFPSIAKEGQNFEELMSGLPQGLVAALGLEKISFTSILGYYATKQLISVNLFGSIFAIMLGANAIAREESERTIEFLLSKPITRTEVITAKLLSVFTLIVAFNVVLTAIMYVVLQMYKIEEFSTNLFLLLSVGVLLLHLTFAAIGFLISVLTRKSRSVISLSIGIVLVAYVLSIFSVLSPKLDFLKYLSPFKYVDPADIISTGIIATQYLILMAVIIAAAIVMTYAAFNRRNISV